MKTTILIGYAQTDRSGNPLGAPTVVSGPPENEKARQLQAKVFAEAKQQRKFPKGVAFLAFGLVTVSDAAARVSVAEEIAA